MGSQPDDSAVDQENQLLQQQYNDTTYEMEQAKAKANAEMLGFMHAQSGPLFTAAPPGEVVNPEKDAGAPATPKPPSPSPSPWG